MAYSDFSFPELEARFGVQYTLQTLLVEAVPVAPSAWLLESLRLGQRKGYTTEKARSERLVSPILLELAERNSDVFTVQSGVMLDVDPAQGLRGECDFLLSYGPIWDFPTAPVFCITEAKKNDMDLGMAQCAAQLIGAWQFNQTHHHTLPVLYGCATTGIEWRFLHFDGKLISLDSVHYHITELARLLGALQAIVDETYPFAPAR